MGVFLISMYVCRKLGYKQISEGGANMVDVKIYFAAIKPILLKLVNNRQ